MHFILIASVAAASVCFPAYGAYVDISVQKEAMLQNLHQETVGLDVGRFLIFSGNAGSRQYGYTVDLIKIDKGVPHFEPLFMEDFDTDAKIVSLSDGVAFPAMSYHFDKNTKMLDYTASAPEGDMRYQYKYQLTGDTFTLLEVLMQKVKACAQPPCKTSFPKIIYQKAPTNAQTH